MLLVMISGETYTRYVLNSHLFDKDLASAPFYFDAKLNFGCDAEVTNKWVELNGKEESFCINVQNFIGNDINPNDITYEFTYSSDKFIFSYVDEKSNQLPAGNKTNNKIKFTVESRKDLSDDEKPDFKEIVIITVKSTYPYAKEIEIPIEVYSLEGRDYFRVNYKILIDEEPNKEFGITIEDANDSYNGISLDSVFGTSRPVIIENGNYSFDVTIPGNYTADVFTNGNRREDHVNKKSADDNTYYSLGTPPVYKQANDVLVVDTDNGPNGLILSYTYTNNAVNSDRTIVVQMTKKSTPVFDARQAVKLVGMSGRGATGIDRKENNGNYPNLVPDGGWNWAFYETDTVPMHDEKDGTYSFTWTFQTNSGNWLLDSFGINGTNVYIPFMPVQSVASVAVEVDKTANPDATDPAERCGVNSCKTTILPDGTIVEIEFFKAFGNLQRIYNIRITNARSDIVVTAGNLNDSGGGAPEIVFYDLVGIADPTDTGGRVYPQSSLLVLSGINPPEFKFSLLSHYENPVLSYTFPNGNGIGSPELTLDEASGVYTISKLDTPSGSSKIGLLTIIAEPIRYAIKYNFGEVKDVLFASSYDDNDGNYYTIKNTNVITLSNDKPYDKSVKKTFDQWCLSNGEKSTTVNRGHVFKLDEILDYAVKNEDGIYIINVEAVWKE